MNLRLRSAYGWTLSVLGALALIMGVVGLVSPDSQFRMMGFELIDKRPPGDYTPALSVTTSLAAVNMGILYLLGVAKGWPGFAGFTLWARSWMCAGFIALLVAGRAPHAYVGAAIWEGLGAALIASALWWDGRKRR